MREPVQPAGAPAKAEGETGRWVQLDKDGKFYVAICALGKRPKLGEMFSPEHSATRDPVVARDVPCPPPLPVVAAPGRGLRALAFPAAKPFSATDTESDGGSFGELVTIEEPGAERSVVSRASGERATIPNVQLIALERAAKAKAGDFVLVMHPDASEGVVRAVVRPGGKTARRLSGFGSGSFGEDFVLAPGTFRVIGRDLDPGSLIAIPLADRVEVAMVLAAGTVVVGLDDGGRLRAFHPSSITALPVAPTPRKGMRVYAPFASGLDAGTVRAIHAETSQVGIVWDAFPDGEPKWFGAGCYIDRDLSLGLYREL